jgi:GNAT superfamily N-acetyltransferase
MKAGTSPEPAGESQVTVLPATVERWPDIEAYFRRIPCWCQYWRVSASEYGRASKGQDFQAQLANRRQALRCQLEGPTPPGVVAYLEDQMIGWCGFGPRQQMERLVRSRTIPAIDDLPVWSIVCFEVRPGFRRRGVARALLQGAIDCARSCGAPALEAYPVDPEGARISAPFAYVGLVSMFERAGFRRMVKTSARSAGLPRWLMRLDLLAPASAQEV